MDANTTLIPVCFALSIGWTFYVSFRRNRDYDTIKIDKEDLQRRFDTLEQMSEAQAKLIRVKRIEVGKWQAKYNNEVTLHRKTDRELVDVKTRLASFQNIATQKHLIHYDNFKRWQFRYVSDETEILDDMERIKRRARHEFSKNFSELFKFKVDEFPSRHGRGTDKIVTVEFAVKQIEE